MLDVNVNGVFFCTQAVIPAMQANSYGRIINFSSTAGKNVSTVGGASYTTSKAAVLGPHARRRQGVGALRHHRERRLPRHDRHRHAARRLVRGAHPGSTSRPFP